MKAKELIYAFSGDDYRIIRQCDETIRVRFLIIGLFVPLIFTLCLCCCLITFMQMFRSAIAAVILAVFFSWMITNIYVLLLYTLTRNSLPYIKKPGSTRLSRAVRLGFVCFISLIISKPIESLLYRQSLDRDIQLYKTAIKHAARNKIRFYYQKQIDEIARLARNTSYGPPLIRKKMQDQRREIHNICRVIDSSDHYLQRIKFLNTLHPSCWFITLLFMALFVFPVYLKYTLRKSAYYDLKGETEKQLVTTEYSRFKKRYTSIFKTRYNKKVAYSESYGDAPYNTIRKKDNRTFYTEQSLLSELYHART